MLWPDVIELKEFYASRLGQVACRLIRRRIHDIWPGCSGDNVMGIGFTLPYLLPYVSEQNCVGACMPAAQGVIHWQPGEHNLTYLADETQLPIADNRINRVLLVHAMENSEHMRLLLQEVWRILTPGGRVLAIVPNRRGIWARAPQSPFAHGQPFTAPQLRHLLTESQFTVTQHCMSLFLPPTHSNTLLKSAGFMEEIGRRIFPAIGGLVLMEAEKRIYSPTRQAVPARAKKILVPAAATQPAMMGS